MRSFTSSREDLQAVESYDEFKFRAWNEEQVTLNDLVKQWQREKREACIKEDLLVLEAILKAAALVVSVFLADLFLIEFLAGA